LIEVFYMPKFSDDEATYTYNASDDSNPRRLTHAGTHYFKETDTLDDADGVPLDKDWVIRSFLLKDKDLEDKDDITNRYWSSASVKFTDTRLGCNIGVNSRPQFTPYSDIRVKGRINSRNDVSVSNTKGNYGMGRYYSEAIDDNAQTIYLRFGVPQYSALTYFFSNAFSSDAVRFARTGRGPSAWYSIGQVAGTIGAISAFPIITLSILGSRVLNVFFKRPSSRYYNLKPAMHMYWSAVNMLVNTIGVNRGLLPRTLMSNGTQGVGSTYELDKVFLEKLHELMPEVFTESNGFDMFKFATKAERLHNAAQEQMFAQLDSSSADSYEGIVKKAYELEPSSFNTIEKTLADFLGEHANFSYYTSSEEEKVLEAMPQLDPATGKPLGEVPGDWTSFFDAEFKQGAQFAVFKVDHVGTVQESFANSVGESDLSNKFNSISSQAREARFTFAQGNISDNVVANTVESFVGAATDVASGVLDGATFGLFGSLQGLLGSGYIDIPKHWQSSNVSLPKITYTMQLVSPYGNVISQMQNIFIPLCMIMAGALPLSTGRQSYTSPFLVQIFDRGRCQVRLGMIESVSISRGTTNLPFTISGNPLGIDVSFSIVDLSSIMHMPVSTGSLFKIISGTDVDKNMDEDNILMDYLAVLSGQDMYSQLYFWPKAKLNFAKRIRSLEKLHSAGYWASYMSEWPVVSMVKYIMPSPGVITR
jgi:hypothetical protein